MKLLRATLVLLFAAGVFAACNTTAYVPAGNAGAASSPQVIFRNLPSGVSIPDLSKACAGIPFSRVPGEYVSMIALGDLKGGTFAGTGLWFLEDFKIGTPGATPTPGVTPTPVKGTPIWIYYGKFSLTHKRETGCAFLIATKSGKPFPKSKGNAASLDTPIVDVKHLKVSITSTEGAVKITIHGVSATGGSGSASLLKSPGGSYDTATITLMGRVALP